MMHENRDLKETGGNLGIKEFHGVSKAGKNRMGK
jgi:hypothetical protein